MQLHDQLDLILVAVTVAVMLPAAVSDWRAREVPDRYWAVLGIIGLTALTCRTAAGAPGWEHAALAAGGLLILADMLVDSERLLLPRYVAMALLFIVPLHSLHLHGDPHLAAWASVPVSYVVYLGMYYLGILPGGADVKCLVSLALLFPVYPSFAGLPLIPAAGHPAAAVLTFSVSALFLAALLTAAAALPRIAAGVARGERGAVQLTRMMGVDAARASHVWPVQDVVGGELTPVRCTGDPAEVYDRLAAAGIAEVRVTPMIPFIVPLTAAVLILAVLGNPLLLI